MIRSVSSRRRALCVLAGCALLLAASGDVPAADDPAAPGTAVPAGITVKEDGARWESGYGEKFFQVVGTVTNGSPDTLGAIRIRTELLDGDGKVVAAFDGWNGRAEALGDLSVEAARAELAKVTPGPLAPGTSDRFRATFLADETPAFTSHRIRVVAVLPPS